MHGRIELRARRVAQRNQCIKGVLNIMSARKKIEVFSAGCSACKETIEIVKRLAGSHELVIHDMNKSEVASKAKEYGVRTVPAVVIDGKLASCCANHGPDEHVFRSALA
jgi:glutaredoxin 3